MRRHRELPLIGTQIQRRDGGPDKVLPAEIALHIERPQVAHRVADDELVTAGDRGVRPRAVLEGPEDIPLVEGRVLSVEILYPNADRRSIIEMTGVERRHFPISTEPCEVRGQR